MIDEQFKTQVDTFVDEVWEDLVEDIDRLVRIESVEDPQTATKGMPWGAQSYQALVEALAIAERLGLETTNVDGYLGFGDVRGNTGETPYIATIAHTDIVPIGRGWNFNPLKVTRHEGYLVGRGVLDDKGPCVLALYATHFFARLAAKGIELPYTLRCIIGNNEETGMGDVPYYLERYPQPAFCFTPDANFPLICGEKGLYSGVFSYPAAEKNATIRMISGGTVTNAVAGHAEAEVRATIEDLPQSDRIQLEALENGYVKITAKGIGGHASLPEGTINALALLSNYLLDHQLYDEAHRPFLELVRTLCTDAYGETVQVASEDNKFGKLTCVAGKLWWEEGTLYQSVDCRYPTSTSADALDARFQELAAQFGATYTRKSNANPFYIDPSSPEITALLDTYHEYAQNADEAYVIGGGTYARHFQRAVAFGPFDTHEMQPAWVGMEHGPDEAVSEESMKRALKIYITSLARLMELSF